MKRTKQINLQKMRKAHPLSLALAGSLFLTACGSPEQEAMVYRSEDECIRDNPDQAQQCMEAYDTAIREAESSAPKYSSRRDCESEFGYNRCVQSSYNNWFMPALGGFMLGRLLNNNRYDYHHPAPVYSYRGQWVGSDGSAYGSSYNRRTTVPENSFKAKPRVTRTMSRGGFGSTAQAKSSWGGSSSRSSYGG